MIATTSTLTGATWSRLRSDRVVVWAAGAGAAWLVLYAALNVAAQHSHGLTLFVGDVLYLVPIAASVVLSLFAARRAGGRVRRAWQLLVVSNALWLAGEIAWSVYGFVSTTGPPVPSVADAGYLLAYVFALPALLIGVGAQGWLSRTRALLDALLVAGAAAAIGWQLVIGPLISGAWDAAAVTTFLYPVLSVSIASVLVAVLLSGRHVPPSMLLVGIAFGFAALSDAGYAYLTALNSFTDSSWLNLGWQAQAITMGLGALVAVRWPEEGAVGDRVDGDAAILPALFSILTLAGLALFDVTAGGGLSPPTTALIMLLFLGMLLRQSMATRDRTHLAQQLRIAAITDPLTGLYNRRFFDEMLDHEVELVARQRQPVSVILLDLDHFKEVNDTYGHSAGDVVLVEAANRLKRSLRANDVISRYGGEEFIALLRATDEQDAVNLAEQIRVELSGMSVAVPSGDQVRLTASLGVATADPSSGEPIGVDRLINAADRAVYVAKARGRDRVAGFDRGTHHLLGEPAAPRELVWLADEIDAVLGDREHSAAVARWSLKTAARLGLECETQRRTAAAARLHDIGKIAISRSLLAKRTALDGQEWEQIRRHPEESARLLTEFGNRPDLAPLVAAHHEQYDGSGYPHGLAGTDIPIEARIIAVCDTWAEMRSSHSYSGVRAECEAWHQIQFGRGSCFDPAVVDAFLALLDEGEIDEPHPLDNEAVDRDIAGAMPLRSIAPWRG